LSRPFMNTCPRCIADLQLALCSWDISADQA
jgi:hypothetical protein